MIIETERIMLREMTRDDFDALYKVLGDSDIMRHYCPAFVDQRPGYMYNKRNCSCATLLKH